MLQCFVSIKFSETSRTILGMLSIFLGIGCSVVVLFLSYILEGVC